MTHWEKCELLLAVAQQLVEEMLEENDDSKYGLLTSAKEHIMLARGDLDADLK